MQFPQGDYISPLAIQSLWTGLQQGQPILNLASDGTFTLTLPNLDQIPNAEIEFVAEGTFKQALAYDMGRVHTEQKNAIQVIEATNKLEHFQDLIKQRVQEVRTSVSPNIPEKTQAKIDKIMSGLDIINFKPQIATFGKFCAKERELLDRCYLANSSDVLVCNDYSAKFNQCVYAEQSAQNQSQTTTIPQSNNNVSQQQAINNAL